MKKLLFLLASTVIFTGCFGSNNDGAIVETSNISGSSYQTNNFSLTIPQDWEVVEKNSFTSNVPTETMVAIRNNIKSTVFTATANVTETPVPPEVSTVDFARSSINEAKTRLQNFQELSRSEAEISQFSFQGKLSASEPIVQHTQKFQVKDGIAYTLTTSHLSTENQSVVNTLNQVLESFQLN